MTEDMHVTRRLALLPDQELLHLLEAMDSTGPQGEQNAAMNPTTGQDAQNEVSEKERRSSIEKIRTELKARGLLGAPWWMEC